MKLYKELQGSSYCESQQNCYFGGCSGAVIGVVHMAGLPRGGGDKVLVLVPGWWFQGCLIYYKSLFSVSVYFTIKSKEKRGSNINFPKERSGCNEKQV